MACKITIYIVHAHAKKVEIQKIPLFPRGTRCYIRENIQENIRKNTDEHGLFMYHK